MTRSELFGKKNFATGGIKLTRRNHIKMSLIIDFSNKVYHVKSSLVHYKYLFSIGCINTVQLFHDVRRYVGKKVPVRLVSNDRWKGAVVGRG